MRLNWDMAHDVYPKHCETEVQRQKYKFTHEDDDSLLSVNKQWFMHGYSADQYLV